MISFDGVAILQKYVKINVNRNCDDFFGFSSILILFSANTSMHFLVFGIDL